MDRPIPPVSWSLTRSAKGGSWRWLSLFQLCCAVLAAGALRSSSVLVCPLSSLDLTYLRHLYLHPSLLFLPSSFDNKIPSSSLSSSLFPASPCLSRRRLSSFSSVRFLLITPASLHHQHPRKNSFAGSHALPCLALTCPPSTAVTAAVTAAAATQLCSDKTHHESLYLHSFFSPTGFFFPPCLI